MEVNNFNKRYSDATWLKPCDVIIVGLGAVGHGTGLSLLANGYHLTVYDYDTVSEENVIPQGYSKLQLNYPKTVAFNDNANVFINAQAIAYNKLYDGMSAEVMISAVDNMEGRRQIFESFMDDEDAKLFIDARMIPCQFTVFCLDKNSENFEENAKKYEATLFTDSEVIYENCSFKSSRHTNLSIQGYISALVCNYVSNKDVRVLEIPFQHEFNSNFFTLCQYHF